MESLATKECAAVALSKALSDHGIRHAYIGGFAVNLLGSQRATEDIDVLIDLPRDTIRPRVQEATAHDARFELRGLKLVFQEDSAQPVVPIETLPTGDLGLPCSFDAMLVGRRTLPTVPAAALPIGNLELPDRFNMMLGGVRTNLPLLPPGILVLTKVKRCVQFLDSSRPRTLAKLAGDLQDIVHLLRWLAQHEKVVDFAGYDTADSRRERLYSAVQELGEYWRSECQEDHLALLKGALTAEDAEKVLG